MTDRDRLLCIVAQNRQERRVCRIEVDEDPDEARDEGAHVDLPALHGGERRSPSRMLQLPAVTAAIPRSMTARYSPSLSSK